AKGGAQQLNSDRQRLLTAGETARQTDARQPRDVARDGEDVGKVHAQRVAGLFADLERGDGAGGREDDIALLKGPVEGALDQGADLERADVEAGAVSLREVVRPDHNAPLHLLAEPLRAALAEQLDDVLYRLTRAVPEVDAVVAGEVAAGLAGGDHVVRCD